MIVSMISLLIISASSSQFISIIPDSLACPSLQIYCSKFSDSPLCKSTYGTSSYFHLAVTKQDDGEIFDFHKYLPNFYFIHYWMFCIKLISPRTKQRRVVNATQSKSYKYSIVILHNVHHINYSLRHYSISTLPNK